MSTSSKGWAPSAGSMDLEFIALNWWDWVTCIHGYWQTVGEVSQIACSMMNSPQLILDPQAQRKGFWILTYIGLLATTVQLNSAVNECVAETSAAWKQQKWVNDTTDHTPAVLINLSDSSTDTAVKPLFWASQDSGSSVDQKTNLTLYAWIIWSALWLLLQKQ
jgi:hypothetical protein